MGSLSDSSWPLVILIIIGTKTGVVITTVTTMAMIIKATFRANFFLSSLLHPPFFLADI